jgi:hypothetical protein
MKDQPPYPSVDFVGLLGSFDPPSFVFQILYSILALVLIAVFVTTFGSDETNGDHAD